MSSITGRQGSIAEQKCILKLMSQGFRILQPLNSFYPYDFVIQHEEAPNTFKRIQVKSTQANTRGWFEAGKGRYEISLAHSSSSKIYSSQECDYIICLVTTRDALEHWYVIPISQVTTSNKIRLYPKNKKSKGTYESFKESWHLLLDT